LPFDDKSSHSWLDSFVCILREHSQRVVGPAGCQSSNVCTGPRFAPDSSP
jgi:hypothetical protein